MNINGVDFEEDAETPYKSPKLKFAEDDAGVTRSLCMRVVNSDAVVLGAQALLGSQRLSSDNGGPAGAYRAWITRELPHPYPWPSIDQINQSGDPPCYASSIPMAEPIGKATGAIANDKQPEYLRYRLQVQYTTRLYWLRSDSFVAATAGPLAAAVGPAVPDEGEKLASGGVRNTRYISKHAMDANRVISLGNGFAQWTKFAAESVTTAQAIPGGLPWSEYRLKIVYTWWLVPWTAIPWVSMGLLANRVNEATFDGHPAQTLLYSSSEVRPIVGPLGDRLGQVQHRMIYMPNYDSNAPTPATRGWNSVLRVYGGKVRYWPISADGEELGASNRIFQLTPASGTSGMAALFRPDQT